MMLLEPLWMPGKLLPGTITLTYFLQILKINSWVMYSLWLALSSSGSGGGREDVYFKEVTLVE
jgi:hypothetical protein